MVDDAAVQAADRAARIWAADDTGPIAPGSEAHKYHSINLSICPSGVNRSSVASIHVIDFRNGA